MKKILFEERFSQNGKPNPDNWIYETGGFGWGNNELQYYSDNISNAYIKDGVLNIVAKKEEMFNNHYTSTKLTTYQKHSFKYGSFRICCKLPHELGLWPAFWLLPNSHKEGVRWPECGEIDIFENVTKEPGRFVYSIHSKNHNFKAGNQLSVEIQFDKSKLNDFLELRMDWTKDYFEYFIDGKSIGKINKTSDMTEDDWPFDNEFYLIMNLAVGGGWPGNPKDDFVTDRLQIKYVKVVEI